MRQGFQQSWLRRKDATNRLIPSYRDQATDALGLAPGGWGWPAAEPACERGVIDTETARTFLEVSAAGSFMAAADRHHMTQSKDSTRIQQLEQQLVMRM
ncbi:helix-turn-helix domain-containing protein [Azospirillum endophyticum]